MWTRHIRARAAVCASAFEQTFFLRETRHAVGLLMSHQERQEPMVFIHIHSIGRLEDERNPKTVAALTETVAEELRYHLCV
ncbi:hypothetical protein PC121_g15174 [Phytophthora cactorum]|nr:hypothetical protein PC121_g15174 [Phytophthora cactorum]